MRVKVNDPHIQLIAARGETIREIREHRLSSNRIIETNLSLFARTASRR
jgi:hypothetical protein